MAYAVEFLLKMIYNGWKEKWQEEFELGDSCYNANLKVMKNHTYEMK